MSENIINCCVCYLSGQPLVTLSCHLTHTVCFDCFEKLSETCKCPLCRQEFIYPKYFIDVMQTTNKFQYLTEQIKRYENRLKEIREMVNLPIPKFI